MLGLQLGLNGHSLPFPLFAKQPLTMFPKTNATMKLILLLILVMIWHNIVRMIQRLRCLFDTILGLDKSKNDARLLGSNSKQNLWNCIRKQSAMQTFTWAFRHLVGSCQKHYIQTDMAVQKASHLPATMPPISYKVKQTKPDDGK
jgi:hypothetical protein